jgi:hypothetical protein
LERYVFTNLHEEFLCYFPELLQECILRLKDNHPNDWIRPVEWTSENIAWIQKVNNKFTHAMDFWLDNIVAGFITEFVVDTAKCYNVAEHEFFKGPRGIYIRSLYLSINILMHDKGVMTMELDS